MSEESIDVRLAVLESNFGKLLRELEARDKRAEARDEKLDELLQLKQKGMGALWLASLIIGTSFIAAAATILGWIRG